MAPVGAICDSADLHLLHGDRHHVRGNYHAHRGAALGAAATVVLTACYRALSSENLIKALKCTVNVSCIVLFVIVGATALSQWRGFSGATNEFVGIVGQLNLSPTALMVTMILILLVLGCFVDQVSMMLLTLPFFMPLSASTLSGSACAVPIRHATSCDASIGCIRSSSRLDLRDWKSPNPQSSSSQADEQP